MLDMRQNWYVAPPVMARSLMGLESLFFSECPEKTPLKKGAVEYFVNFFS